MDEKVLSHGQMSTDLLNSFFCARVYKDATEISNNGFTNEQKDLFMEQRGYSTSNIQFYWTKVNPRNPLISLIIFTKVRQFCKPSFFKNYGRDTLYEFPQVGIIVTYIAPAMYLDTVSYVCLVIFPFHHLTITSQDLYQEV